MKDLRYAEFYRIPSWGDGFFDVDPDGRVTVLNIPLLQIIKKAQNNGLSLPLLIRFPHILKTRALWLYNAFLQAKKEISYQGDYFPIYPIKVNQQKHVIEVLLESHPSIGLEAGSKSELLAVLGLIEKNAPRFIICNGYKDADFIKLAFLGQQMGHRVVIVMEKFAELALILAKVKQLQICPMLGIRIKLSSLGKGNWQNTGGEKSKFGLSTTEVLTTVRILKEKQLQPHLQLLHCHLGSQIPDIEDIQKGLSECARVYGDLKKIGVPLEYVDVGGGLGVDYEGRENTSHYSMNYSIPEYARTVVHTFYDICTLYQLPHPHLMTEAGRAMTAHHAVLVTQLMHCEKGLQDERPLDPNSSPHTLFQSLYQTEKTLSLHNVKAIYHQAKHTLSETLQMYIQGTLSLTDRAVIEQLVYQIYHEIYRLLQAKPVSETPDFLHELTEKLAYKLVCNFSVFRSVPDVWGIDQTFPIVPLEGLQEKNFWPTVIQDITCDSDGRIDHYVSQNTCKTILPMPVSVLKPGSLIGVFLVGAYQEILGDIHNLFGNTDSVHVIADPQEQFKLVFPIKGDTTASLLQAVMISPEAVLEAFQKKLKDEISLEWLRDVFSQSSYLGS